MRSSVLIFAPQAAIRATLARILMPLGFSVELASSEKTARQLASKQRFAAAIMAVRSATADDVALIHEFRSAADKLVLLAGDAGATERLARSFPEALVCSSQRLEHERVCDFLGKLAHTASTPAVASGSEFLHFADRMLDVAGRIFIDAGGREVPLTRGEFALLVAFARNGGRVLSRHQLRNAMDGGSVDSYDRSIDMLVARLRRKVEPNPSKPQFIVTVPGVGYKFTPHVRRGQPTTAPPVSQDTDDVLGAGETPRAERRQVTVLSCHILGFVALAAKLDPEDLDRVIGPVYAACAETIARHRGTIVRTLGDGVLAYFGYPTAEENDAPRAVRAALELLRAIPALEAPPIGNFHARIGVATGLMLVGELTSMGARDAGGWGEALNLALHLERAAPLDGVVIAAATRSLIGRLFECRQLDPVELQEGLEPVPAWHVIDEKAGISRFEALRREGMLGFVGREVEIERLRQCWSRVLRGSGQVVLVTGEAGIGKSRLAVELQERLCGEPHAVIRYSGAPHRADAPMSVLIDELQRSASFAANDTVAWKMEKLHENFAAFGVATAEAAALGCMFLGLPFEPSPQVDQPQKRKERAFAALLTRIEAMAARQPVFAIVEDAHWVDPTSLEFITILVERASAMRLLLVIVARSEFVPPWPEHSHVTTLALSRLSHADSAMLIQQVSGEHRIPVSVEAKIIARADGVPLFVEELTKSILESTCNDGGGGALGSPPVGKAPIPMTLNGLLLARFDRLDRGKTVAQAGAVIGREFSVELLRMIAGLDERTLSAALDQLVASGLVFRRGLAPEATYAFKHALVRDAAYAMLLRERRQMLHASVARAYEDHFPETGKAQPEILAYHYREGGAPAKAIGYLIAAAERALLRSATTQGLSHLAQARELIDGLPSTPARRREEIKLQVVLANTLMPTKGHSAPETKAAIEHARLLIEQAEALGEPPEDPLLLFSALFGVWLASYSAGAHDETYALAARLLALAEKQGKTAPRMIGHRVMGISLLFAGEIVEARFHLDRAIALYDPAEHRALRTRFSIESGVALLVFRSRALWLLGYPEAALADAEQALKDAREIGQATTLLSALIFGSLPFVDCGDYTRAIAQLDEAALLANEKGALFWKPRGEMIRGYLLALTGKVADAVEMITTGIATYQSMGATSFVPFYLSYLAMAYAELGQFDDAWRTIGEALTAMKTIKEGWCEAEIHRIAGEIALKSPQPEAAKAQTHFERALAVARAQQAKSLELRAATSIARLWRDQGQREKARGVLAAVYGWFTEGFETRDLMEAKALLDALAS